MLSGVPEMTIANRVCCMHEPGSVPNLAFLQCFAQQIPEILHHRTSILSEHTVWCCECVFKFGVKCLPYCKLPRPGSLRILICPKCVAFRCKSHSKISAAERAEPCEDLRVSAVLPRGQRDHWLLQSNLTCLAVCEQSNPS